jgi:hypothetical protein
MFNKVSFKTFLAAGALALTATGANAATVITVDDSNPAEGAIQGTVTCYLSCAGYTNPGWSNTNAVMFTTSPDIKDETAKVNEITGELFITGKKTDPANGSMTSFTSSAMYILFKIGGGNELAHFLIRNTSGGSIDISWAKGNDQGTGLSHYTEFGGTAAVPVPAAGLLLIGALGGLAALRRRRRTA